MSVKFGALRDPATAGRRHTTARPAAVKNFLAYTLQRLGVDHIDIYRPARLDPTVPIEDTIGAIADMVKAGYVRHIGLSEVGAETIRRAACGASDRRSADRVFADRAAASKGRHPADLRASSASASPPTACSRAGCSAAAWPRTPAAKATAHRAHAALPAGQRRAKPAPGRSAARDRRARRAQAPAQLAHRLGALARRRHRAGDRRAPARPARRVARRARPDAHRRRPRAHRAGVSRRVTAGSATHAAQMAHLDSEGHA